MTVSECLEEISKEYYKWLENENIKMQSNWNSLREYVKEMKLNKRFDNDVERFTAYDDVLDKMNELEGKDNNDNI